MTRRNLLAILLVLGCASSRAQNEFPNTLTLPDDVASPKASLNSMAWLAGRWLGEAFGGMTEELWSPPAGNSMMGVFRSIVDNKVNFYEIVTIVEENETLLLRLKHFHANLKGWEEKDVTQDFRLVKVTPDRIYFEGFTFEKVSKDKMIAYVVIGSKKETQKELSFVYERVNLN